MIHQLNARLHPIRLWTPPVSYSLRDWLRYLYEGERGATGTSISNYLEEKLLNLVLSGTAYSAPSGLTCHLYTAAPSDTGGGTEVTGGSYAAQTVTSSFGDWVTGSVANDVAITFPDATADWGTVTHTALKDQSSNYLFWGALGTSKIIGNGDGAAFAIGELTCALD